MFHTRKKVCLTVVVFSVILAAMYLFFEEYQHTLRDVQMNRAKFYITDFAMTRSLDTHENLTRILLTAQEQAAILGQFPAEDMPKRVVLYSASIFEHGSKGLGFVDAAGVFYTATGMRLPWEKPSFLSSVLAGRPCITDGELDPLDREPVNVAAAPVFQNGRVTGAFVILFTSKQMDLAFRASAVQSKGPSLLVSARGDVISTSVAGFMSGANLFAAARQEQLQVSIAPDELQVLMRRGKSGLESCEIEGTPYLMAYAPVQINGWYTFSFLPLSYVHEETAVFMNMEKNMLWRYMLLVGGLLLYVVGMQFFCMRRESDDFKRMQAISGNIPGGMLRVCDDGHYFRIVNASPGMYAMTGYSAAEFHSRFGENFLEFVHPDDRERIARTVQGNLADGQSAEIEYRIFTKDGDLRWFLGRGQAVGDGHTVDCVVLDITEKKLLEEHLAMDAQRYRLLFELSGSIFYEYNCETHDLAMGHGFKEKFGFMPEINRLPETLFDSRLVHRNDWEKVEELREVARGRQPTGEATIRLRKSTGRHVWCRIEQVHIFNAKGELVRVLGKITDVDQQVRVMERLNREKQRDPFTRLLNKVSTREMVDSYLVQAGANEYAAMCVIDLDHFKNINDTYGHEIGDAVLFQASKHLRQTFRSSDIIGRIGGDEFLVFFKGLPNTEVLNIKLEHLRNLFREGCYVNGVDVKMSISVGIALHPQHGATFAKLFRNADKAMYEAKKTRDCWVVHED